MDHSPHTTSVAVPIWGPDTGLSLPAVLGMTAGSVRVRLGRSLITLSGVVLGTAFLMAVLTSSLLRGALAREEAARTAAADVAARVGAELGTLEGRRLAVLVESWDAFTATFLAKLGAERNVVLVLHAPTARVPPGVGERAESAAAALAEASALIVCNRGATRASELPPGAAGLGEKLVMDLQGLYVAADLQARGLRYADLSPAESGSDVLDRPAYDQADETARALWLIGVSLLVSGIGVANALVMSVTERFREIGTLKCLGAPDRLVVLLFILESAMLGVVGSAVGVVAGLLVSAGASAAVYGGSVVWEHLPGRRLAGSVAACLAVGLLVAILAAIYPAMIAARMTSAEALRSEF